MPQTFCYLCIKKPLTLPHTPLRLLKHRTKNTYEPPKARIRSTNQKHEPNPRTTKRTTKSTNQKNEPRKERPKARTTKSTTEKHEPPKHEYKSTNPAPMFQARLTAPLFASPPLKATKHNKRPNRFLAPQNAILPLS